MNEHQRNSVRKIANYTHITTYILDVADLKL